MLCLLDVRGRPIIALIGRCGEVVGGEPGGEERAIVLKPAASGGNLHRQVTVCFSTTFSESVEPELDGEKNRVEVVSSTAAPTGWSAVELYLERPRIQTVSHLLVCRSRKIRPALDQSYLQEANVMVIVKAW